MILIVVQMPIRADRRDEWLRGIRRYADAVQREPGNPTFECFESIDAPNRFVVVEGFPSRESGDAHVQTPHFAEFIQWAPTVISEAPKIINVEVPDGWAEMAELKPQR